MNLEILLIDNGEIEFIYNGSHYLIGRYYKNSIFRKRKIEYWFISENRLKKFNDIDSVLNINIQGRRLGDVLNEIEII